MFNKSSSITECTLRLLNARACSALRALVCHGKISSSKPQHMVSVTSRREHVYRDKTVRNQIPKSVSLVEHFPKTDQTTQSLGLSRTSRTL